MLGNQLPTYYYVSTLKLLYSITYDLNNEEMCILSQKRCQAGYINGKIRQLNQTKTFMAQNAHVRVHQILARMAVNALRVTFSSLYRYMLCAQQGLK